MAELLHHRFLQAVKQAEQEVAKEVQAVKDASTAGIQAAAATSGSDRPEKQDVAKLIQDVDPLVQVAAQ